jgi:hypothetical protein
MCDAIEWTGGRGEEPYQVWGVCAQMGGKYYNKL